MAAAAELRDADLGWTSPLKLDSRGAPVYGGFALKASICVLLTRGGVCAVGVQRSGARSGPWLSVTTLAEPASPVGVVAVVAGLVAVEATETGLAGHREELPILETRLTRVGV
jgi:hypothetical protein